MTTSNVAGVRTRLAEAKAKRTYLTSTIDPKEKSALIVAISYFKKSNHQNLHQINVVLVVPVGKIHTELLKVWQYSAFPPRVLQ